MTDPSDELTSTSPSEPAGQPVVPPPTAPERQQPEMPPPSAGSILNVAKTWLDPEACKKVVSRLITRTESRLRERSPAPLKSLTPITRFKKASACAESWDSMTGKGLVRFCKRCQLLVYDFSSLDKAEAEELIFQKEGRRDALCYKRLDGKFLTTDCPVGISTKRNMIIAAVTGLLILAGFTALLSSKPPASLPPIKSKGTITTTAPVKPSPIPKKATTDITKPAPAEKTASFMLPSPTTNPSPGPMSGNISASELQPPAVGTSTGITQSAQNSTGELRPLPRFTPGGQLPGQAISPGSPNP